MYGITSYGGYIPRWRLKRSSAYAAMGWYAPELRAYSQGERAFCHVDEDALTLAVAASRDCLSGLDTSGVAAMYLASTSLPFADRLNAGIAKTALHLRDTLRAQDIAGSQRAGTSALVTALHDIQGSGDRNILVTASERRLAQGASADGLWQGDGAASVLVGQDRVIAAFLGSHSITRDFAGHYRSQGSDAEYAWEDRWIREEGYAAIIPEVVRGLLDNISLTIDDVNTIIYPCFSPVAHRKIGDALGAPDKVHENLFATVGDTGTAHPLVMLVDALETAQPGEVIVAVGLGSGADALCFRVTKAIADLPRGRGISRFLARKRVTDNYTRFLAFQGRVDIKTGIRREAPQKTALTALWRNRDMILGLVGGRCSRCGTRQFPGSRYCVNPACRAKDTQTPYNFADQLATIKTYTADYLGPSTSPPNLYGMIQFDGGGRMLVEFADCELEDLTVGKPVRMCFRKRYEDKTRGFHGYFWKAVPADREDR